MLIADTHRGDIVFRQRVDTILQNPADREKVCLRGRFTKSVLLRCRIPFCAQQLSIGFPARVSRIESGGIEIQKDHIVIACYNDIGRFYISVYKWWIVCMQSL